MIHAITNNTCAKDLRSLDRELLKASDNVASRLSKLMVRIHTINYQLQIAKAVLHRGDDVRYVPADYESWLGSIFSSKKSRELRNDWLQKMQVKSWNLNYSSSIKSDIENLGKEYELFQKAVEQYSSATEASWQHEKGILAGWKSVVKDGLLR